MGQYFSANTFYGQAGEETFNGSGIFDPISWQPTVFTFDINRNTLDVENLEVVLLGSPIGVSGKGVIRTRLYSTTFGEAPYLYAGTVSVNLKTRTAVRYGSSANTVIRTSSSSPSQVYYGIYYLSDTKTIYNFIAHGSSSNLTIEWNSQTYSPETEDDEYVRMFYGEIGQAYSLVMTSPLSRYFDVNQSSELKFALRGSDGFEIDVDAEVEAVGGIVPSNWNFDPSTKTLTLLSSASPKAINIKATYETSAETYSSTFTFLVRVNNPYTGGGISQPNGGAGSYENGTFGDPSTSDDITAELPEGSTYGNASSSGTFTRYLVNNAYLEIFGDWLWNTSLGLAIAQEVIRFIYGDPSESIISLMSYPFQLTGLEGVSSEFRDFYWGNHNAGYQVPALLTTSGLFDWGTLTFDEYWGNFLDYSPYTRVQLYLPWGTGFVDVNPDEILPGTLSIKTVVEFDKGSCVHILSNQQGAVIGTYSGQCGKQIALMASDYSSKLARVAVMGAVAGGIAVGSAATGAMATASNIASGNFGFRTGARGLGLGLGGGMSAPMLNEGVMIENVSSAVHPPLKIPKGSLATKKHPINISRSGAFTDGSAGLGVQFPYVILSRPTQSVPEEYGAYEGYPSNIYANLGELKGYTEVGEIHLAGFENITVDEMNKLDELLKGGVIF